MLAVVIAERFRPAGPSGSTSGRHRNDGPVHVENLVSWKNELVFIVPRLIQSAGDVHDTVKSAEFEQLQSPQWRVPFLSRQSNGDVVRRAVLDRKTA